MNFTDGIENGQPISAEHILRIVNALSGKVKNDIAILGSFKVTGTNEITGNSLITGNSIVLGDHKVKENLSVSGSFLLNNRFLVQKDGTTFINKLFVQNIDSQIILVSGSLILPKLEEQNSKQLLSIDHTGKVGYVINPTVYYKEKFKFTLEKQEDQTTFYGKINNMSLQYTDIIESYEIYSKIDVSSLAWNEYKDLEGLQDWINKNVDEKTLYWIKIMVNYKQYESGQSEIILIYSKNE